jgi:acetyl/propionyl-CoA carboxylase alpha subunit
MRYRYRSGTTIYDISIERQGEIYQATLDGQSYDLEVLDSQPGQLDLLFAGRPISLYWANDGERKWVSLDGCTHILEKPDARRAARPGEQTTSGQIRSPMPAQVQEIRVSSQETVEKGQIILLLEAMKMEIRIQAPYPGRIKRILVEKGQTVHRDQPLVEMDEPKEGKNGG